jgi:broad specificity phosphatase PhoE
VTRVWLIRHGATASNLEGRYLGRRDEPLIDTGRAQSSALAARLAAIPFDHAVASPTQRAHETAEAILAGRALAIVDDARWAEVDQGRWEGLTHDQVVDQFPGDAEARFDDPWLGRAPGGEALAEVAERVVAAWRSLPSAAREILVVTHATPIRIVLASIAGTPLAEPWRWDIALGSVSVVEVEEDRAHVRSVNEVPVPASADMCP